MSGLALGVDAEAHRAALEAPGPTLAVHGAGADVPHPPSHARLFGRITGEGLLVSEFVPGTRPLAHHFPRRNRIMAALAQAVVVVEAAARSGALITARLALELGRDVLAVPGPVDAATSAGTNALLRDGAPPALGAEDVLRVLRIEPGPAARLAHPGGEHGALWRVLSYAPRSVDELAGRAGMPVARALASLSHLEIDGFAVQCSGGRFARRS